ncbi:MAG: O-antigen ligase family protein [Salinibacter sp.]
MAVLWLMPFIRIEPAPVDFLIWGLGAALFLTRPSAFWQPFAPLVRVAIGLLALSHVSLLWAPELGRAAFFTLATAEMFVISVIFINFSGYPAVRHRLYLAFIGGSLVASVIGILAYFDLFPQSEVFMFFDFRAMSVFQGPNVFGGYLVTAVVLAWFRLPVVRDRLTFWLASAQLGSGFLLTFAIILSGSRMAGGGLAISLALAFLWRVSRDRSWLSAFRQWIRGWPIAVGMVLAVAMVLHPGVWSMLEDRLTLYKSYDHERFEFQEKAIERSTGGDEQANENVLAFTFGLGPGQSEPVLSYATHNLYLRVWYELGLIGLVGLACLLVGVGRALRQRPSTDRSDTEMLAIVLIGILVMSLVIDTLHWRHFFVFMGLALAQPEADDHRDGTAIS